MKPKRNRDNGNLDSLLDTMTSVVGILLIMLIVIQLGVNDTVQRILSEKEDLKPGVNTAQLAEARMEVDRKERAAQALEREIAAAREARESGSAQARELRDAITRLEERLATQQQAAVAARQRQAEVAERQAEIDRLKQELASLKVDYEDSRKTLAATPVPAALPVRTVTLPAPRKAPENAKPLYVMCRKGLVAMVDHEGLIGAVKKALKTYNLTPDEKKEYDDQKFEALFRNRYVGDKDWRIQAVARKPGYTMGFHLHKQPRAGESLQVIQAATSRYRLQLSRIDPRERYLVFVVWPDSYDTYLVARALASRRGLAAGWRPEIVQQGWSPHLGTYRIQGYAANRPPPAAGPAQPPPARGPKPVDVVD